MYGSKSKRPIINVYMYRHLKIIKDQTRAREVLRLAKASPLYDSKLMMYTLSESLSEMGPEVGRMKAFSPGWLENQSIFLHMSYKFYLELLKAGLYKEFYEEIKTGLVPFMDNEVWLDTWKQFWMYTYYIGVQIYTCLYSQIYA